MLAWRYHRWYRHQWIPAWLGPGVINAIPSRHARLPVMVCARLGCPCWKAPW